MEGLQLVHTLLVGTEKDAELDLHPSDHFGERTQRFDLRQRLMRACVRHQDEVGSPSRQQPASGGVDEREGPARYSRRA
eukprot:764311-Hanusia_phi.AAC.3